MPGRIYHRPLSIRLSMGKLSFNERSIKLHAGLNHADYLPEFVIITEGNTSDVEMGRTLASGIALQIDQAKPKD